MKELSVFISCVLLISTGYELILAATAVKEENVTCRTPNNEPADCVPIYDCPKLQEALVSGDTEAVSFLRESSCMDGESLVCCGSKAAYQTPPNTETRQDRPKTPPSTPLVSSRLGTSTPIADRSACGYMVEDRILNGLVAGIDEFPWMAILQYERKDDRSKRFLCGGTLIGPRHVLTAAHCVMGDINQNYQIKNVRLGEFNLATEQDCIYFGAFTDCSDPPLDIPVDLILVHPNYNEEITEKPNDIALIKLRQEVSYTEFIKPICLPAVTDQSPVGTRLTVAGWGRTHNASASAVKIKLLVPVTSKRYCRNKFKKSGAMIRETHICAGGEKGRDSCTGDSGGPLMTRFKDNTGQWYIEGIISFGTTCGTEGWPAVYTKVSAYLDWIESSVNK